MRTSTRVEALWTALAVAAALIASAFVATASAAADLVAPRSECAGQKNIKAPERLQEDAMRCLINYARRQAGAGTVSSNRSLEQASGHKAGDVINCGFSHTACGRPADLYARRFGYASGSWQWGENLGWGRGDSGSARDMLKAWLRSPPHHETMLHSSFDNLGIGLRRGRFAGHSNAAVWVLQLGCHC